MPRTLTYDEIRSLLQSTDDDEVIAACELALDGDDAALSKCERLVYRAYVSATWTDELIAARRATGDSLVTAGRWSVSYTTGGAGSSAQFSCRKYRAHDPRMTVEERDARDGDVFPTTEDAQCYALNAGRLQWFRDWKVERVLASENGTQAG